MVCILACRDLWFIAGPLALPWNIINIQYLLNKIINFGVGCVWGGSVLKQHKFMMLPFWRSAVEMKVSQDCFLLGLQGEYTSCLSQLQEVPVSLG